MADYHMYGKRKKIALLISSLKGGGAELMATRWASELRARGHEVIIYTILNTEGEEDLGEGVECRQFPGTTRLSRVMTLPVWLRRQLAKDGIDVLLSMMTFENIIALLTVRGLLVRNVVVVISERSLTSAALGIQGGGSFARTKGWLAKFFFRRADALVAISHPVAGNVIGAYGVDPSRVFVVPNPVTRGRRRVPVTEAPSELTIGYVGRLVAQKRPVLFVETLKALDIPGRRVRGVVFGDGPMRSMIENRAAALGVEMDFRGWVSSWWEGAGDVDCVVLPSRVEGFGNVLVEAAEAGIPVVAASDALGCADAVVPGVTGELVIGSDADVYAEAVLRCLGSCFRGIEGWLGRFSLDESADLLERVLTSASGDEEVSADGWLRGLGA